MCHPAHDPGSPRLNNMKIYLKTITTGLIITLLTITPTYATRIPCPLKTCDLVTHLGRFLNFLQPAIIILFVLILLAGGFIWMTAGPNEERIKKAKYIIGSAIIGFILMILSVPLTNFFIEIFGMNYVDI